MESDDDLEVPQLESVQSNVPIAPETGSVKRFMSLGSALVREVDLLVHDGADKDPQEVGKCDIDLEGMSELMQQLRVRMSEMKLALRKNARQSKFTDFF